MKTLSFQTLPVRLSLIITILAGLTVMTLDLLAVRQKVGTLQSHLQAQKAARQKAEAALTEAKANWESTAATLRKTRLDLEESTVKQAQLATEAAAQVKRADKLEKDLANGLAELAAIQVQLAPFKTIGWKPEEILAAKNQIKSLGGSLGRAQTEITGLQMRIKYLTEIHTENDEITMPADLTGKVIASDPKWHFVVVNAGQEQGVMERGELLVSRNGKLVAKVRVTRVRKDSSIANVVSGWELGEILEGDRVVAAYPRS